jgi:hypothetical protein
VEVERVVNSRLPARTALLGTRAGAAALLTLGALSAGVVTASSAAAATTIDCDAAAQPSASWTTCQQLVGTAKCVWNNNDGTYTLALGYTNPTADNLFASIPNTGTNTGNNNALTATSGSAADPGHLATFAPGTSTTAFTVTWTPSSKTDVVSWLLMGHTSTWADTFTACPSKPVPVVSNVALGSVGLAGITGLALFRRRRSRPMRSRVAAAVPAAG